MITSNPKNSPCKVDIFILILQMSRFSLKILSNTQESNEPGVSELEFEPKLCLVSNESHHFPQNIARCPLGIVTKECSTLAVDGGFGKIKITPSWLH